VQILKSLNLTYLPKYYGCFINKEMDSFSIVMEYIDGLDLIDYSDAYIETDSNMKLLYIVKEIALAIEETHKAGVMHRDIKPDNIMISQYTSDHPVIKLVDYGLSCYKDKPEPNNCRHSYGGTPAYKDPYSLRDDYESMELADWWSFGHTIFVMFTGRSLFNGEDEFLIPDERLSELIPEEIRSLIINLTNPRLSQNKRPNKKQILAKLIEITKDY
jgi:serine/threonine protein kinase